MSGDRKRILALTATMAVACLLVAGSALSVFYQTHLDDVEAQLTAMVRNEASLIRAIARNEIQESAILTEHVPGHDPVAATLSQIRGAHEDCDFFGETGEYTVARRQGDSIVFEISRRSGETTSPRMVAFDSHVAEPMRRALSGKSGTMTGLDYRGVTVLAAYGPVEALGLGLVAKIDVTEIRAPIFRAAIYAVSTMTAVLLLGVLVFRRVSSPMLRRLEEHTQELEREGDRRRVVEGELRRSGKELAMRARIQQAFLTEPGDQLYKVVLETILESVESEIGVFGFIDEEGSLVVPYRSAAVWDACNVPDKQYVFPYAEWGGSSWPHALRKQTPTLSNDPSLLVPEGHFPIHRFITLPIVHDGEAIGLIQVANKASDYTEEDLHFIKVIAECLAPILSERLERERVERERREARLELEESEERYRRLFETAADSIVILDAETRQVVDANAAAIELYGYTRDEFLRLSQRDLTTEPDHTESIQRVLASRFARFPERIHRKRDGTLFPVEISAWSFSHEDRTLICAFGRDVSERRRAAELLRESENKYRRLFENLRNGYAHCKIIVDENNQAIDWVYLEVNDDFERLTGLERSNVIGRRVTEVIPGIKEAHPELFDIYGTVALTGKEETFDIHVDPLGIWLSISVYSTQRGYFVAVFDNIATERKRAEEAIRASRARLAEHIRETPLAAIEWDREFRVVEWNPAAERMFGYTREEALGRHSSLIVPESAFSHVDDIWAALQSREGGRYSTNDNITKDGRTIICQWYNTLLIGEDGTVVGFASMAQDVTELKRAEEALRESRAKMALHLRNTPLGIIEFDTEGRVTEWNPAAERVFGYTRAEILGRPVGVLVPESGWRQVAAVIAALQSGRGGNYSTTENITKDGRTIVCRWYNTPLIDEAGGAHGAASIVEDITELRQAEETLLEYQERLRALTFESALSEERERRRLAAELHDLVAQPLAFAKIKLGALGRGTGVTSGGEIVEQIEAQIDDAVKNTRALTSRLSPPILYELGFKEAVERLCEQTGSQHGIATTFRDDGAPLPLAEDIEIILFQAVRELLANVVKHSQAARASVTLHREGENVEIDVRDDGIGLDPRRVGFRQRGNSSFGLFGIQERLNLVGGSIEVRPGEGHGSRIILRAPIKRKETQQRGTVDEHQDTARG